MTREEAKNIAYTWHTKATVNYEIKSIIFTSQAVSIIDKIYDDFESRTCENCKFYGAEHEHIHHPNYRTCINANSFTYMQEPHFKDGCNKFKRKQDE